MGKIEKLKMRDFKSFRNNVIPFVEGFTTVVGPNGSGKSNILDAIIFVLGTQSMKTLRAGRLKDLVHHGSRTGTAEVTVVLNADGEKYEIKRLIDKKGMSQFRINGKKTTRNAVVELLTSMNIPPEGHNYIMQGDVTSLINMTPRQRREIIDDVAGIAEYNQKKEQALRELERVEAKIKEAEIILYERKGFLGELKKERDEALRYKKYEKKREALKHAIIYKELKEIEEKFNRYIEEVKKAEREVEELSDKINRTNASIENWQNQLRTLNNEIMSKGEKDQLMLHKEIERIKSNIAILDEKVKSKQEELTRAKRDIENARKQIAQLEKEHIEKNESLVTLENEKKAYEERIKEKQEELDRYMRELKEKNLLVGDVTQRIEEINGEIAKQKEILYSIRADVEQLRERISIKKLSISDEKEEKLHTDKKVEELKERYDELNKELAKSRREVLGFEMEIEELYKKEKGLNIELEKTDEELEHSREQYHALQSKVMTIKHMSGNTASDAVIKAANAGELDGVLGKIEDLCTFDEQYSTALQTAAGRRMYFVVTRDAESATKAIKWLKKKRLGATTFIPLDCIKPVEIPDEAKEALKDPDAIDLAINLVKFDPKYKNAFDYVFGDTIIVRDIDTAKRIGFGTVRMATLDGDLAERSGAVTGGYKQATITLQEIRTIEDLKTRIEKLDKRKNKIINELEDIRASLNNIRSKKAEMELRVKELEVTVNEIKGRIDEFNEITQKAESKYSKVMEEIEKLKSEIIEKEELMREKQAEVEELERKKELIKEKMDSPEMKKVSERINEMQSALQMLNDQKSEIVIQINSIRSEIEKVIGTKKEALAKRIKESEEEIEKLKEEIRSIEKEKETLEETLKEKILKEKELSSSIRGLIEKRESLEKEIREMAEQKGHLQRQLEMKKQRLNELNIEKAKIETKYADLKQEFDESIEVEEFDMTIEEMKKAVEDLTIKMAKLEPINLKAVEVYDKYMQEIESLKEKGKVLEAERQAVLEMMDQIEQRRLEVFMEAYEAIRKYFSQTYKEFFPEAMEETYADIKLENPENPFEGGLLIEARPAGKPIKKIDSMSGGEKALTAIAFLFAIQMYSPAPFYVLDEADAPLDKANSVRLAEMIRKKSAECQFIVITHNGPVIKASDQVIGVSMDKETGSSVVEVDLKRFAAMQQLSKEQGENTVMTK
ncbi:MAG: chromosome segregation protein SMC [Candidatus Diapherotrites archaeon]|nr:chromosome segregation protein SMC [Candidatus Diapherotrites archaeon]